MTYHDFKHPDKQFYPRPLWFWNDVPTEENLSAILDTAETECAYGGFGILPYEACGLEYMGEDYLAAYEYVLKKAKDKGLKLCLYDEWWFPSGSAGGILKKKYPMCCAKRLDKIEVPVEDAHMEVALPEGTLMAAVAMHMETRELINLRQYLCDGKLIWDVPDGDRCWRILFFVCVLSDWDHVNYLDPAAVEKFIEVTHEAYYKRFSSYFGTVIDSAFYDEPQMYAVGGRMWVDDFNERFRAAYGEDPELLYPALWYDIGSGTAAARNQLFRFRSTLYAEGFPKVIGAWCAAHGIRLTGHVDQEEVPNPTGITGDLMKSFQYQDIPGFDEIGFPGRGRKIYKLVSSAAYNWDKPLVMSECFGAMAEDLSVETMYHEAMEQYAKGMNLFVPHAVWLNDAREKIVFHPELSVRNPRYQKTLKPFNEYCARMSYLLQGGRHIADIAVLYPVQSLHTAYHFEWGGSDYEGGPVPADCNYLEIGDWLSRICRRDFTYLHPEVLDDRCTVGQGRLRLNNEVNYESYKLLVLPSADTMSISNLEKITQFAACGGVVIAAGALPVHAAEPGQDEVLSKGIRALFGDMTAGEAFSVMPHAHGGRAYHIPHPDAQLLEEVLLHTGLSFDVDIVTDADTESCLSYIHKVKDGQDLLYLVICHDEDCHVTVRREMCGPYEIWDPHDGSKYAGTADTMMENGRRCISLELAAHHSLLIVSRGIEGMTEWENII